MVSARVHQAFALLPRRDCARLVGQPLGRPGSQKDGLRTLVLPFLDENNDVGVWHRCKVRAEERLGRLLHLGCDGHEPAIEVS